jgi:hypothetical protein
MSVNRSAIATVRVDLSQELGVPTRRASGILYGLTEDGEGPPDAFLTGMGFRFERAGGAQLESPGGWVAGRYERRWASTVAQYRRTIALGGTFIILVHDLYGADGTTIDRWPGDQGDWSDFERFLDRLIEDVRVAGMTPQWDLWNEPDLDLFWARSAEQFCEAWGRVYRKVRAAFPDATIVGPSTNCEPSENDEWWNAYLDFVAANDVVPDIVSWHEIGGRAHGQDPVASRAAVEEMLARRGLRVRDLQVNEYAEASQQNPGQSAWFVARLERAQIDGLRANWGKGPDLHDNLASLLTHGRDGYAPLGDWFTYRSYAGQHGVVVASEPDGAIDVFATRLPDDGRQARLLLGNHGGTTGPVVVVVAGLQAAGLQDPRVLVERIPHDDGRPIRGPVLVRSAKVDLKGPTAVTIVVDYADAHDAFAITLNSRRLGGDRA